MNRLKFTTLVASAGTALLAATEASAGDAFVCSAAALRAVLHGDADYLDILRLAAEEHGR